MTVRRQPKRTDVTAIYVRVSTRAQEDGTSLGSQEERCRAYAAEHALTVSEAHVVREIFSGAELWDRPLLTTLRQAIREHTVSALITYSTDRLSRDPIHLAIIADECERHRVALHFVTEPLDSSPEGALIRYVKGYAAQIEREKIKERTLRGKRAIAERLQLHNHGSELYGYQRDKQTRTRTILEGEADIVRTIYRRFVEDRWSVARIYLWLNDTGVPSPSVGKIAVGRPVRWTKTQLARMLKNAAYAGTTYGWQWQRQLDHHYVTYRPKTEWVELAAGTTPAIVNPELWQAAQTRFTRRQSRQDTRNELRPSLLRGHVFCALCGRSLGPEIDAGRSVYRCASHNDDGRSCGAGRVRADELDAWVWAEVCAVLRDPGRIAEQLQARASAEPPRGQAEELEAARAKVTRITAQQQRLIARFGAGDEAFPWGLIERQVVTLEAEKAKALAVVATLERQIGEQQQFGRQVATLETYAHAVAAQLDAMDLPARRLALEALGVRVEASGRKGGGVRRLSATIPGAGTVMLVSGT